MVKTRLLSLAQVPALLVIASSVFAGGDVHWDYSDEKGPEHWGELSEEFSACGKGQSQSPIDIVDATPAELAPIMLTVPSSTTRVINNGHTLQIDVAPGNTLELAGKSFEMTQFHVHSPSEHQIAGKSYPLELHAVHQAGPGEFAVIAVLFNEGPWNDGLGKIGAVAPRVVGETVVLEESVAELGFLPARLASYRYDGSLTTPPCTEGIRWLVLKETKTISPEQVENYVGLIGKDARGQQPMNGRQVVESTD